MLKDILGQSREPIDTIVETGTHEGEGTALFSTVFKTVYTIELDPRLFQEAKQRCGHLDNVILIHGDSRDYLPPLSEELKRPVLWYLDAHWCVMPSGKPTAETFPLWDELDVLCKRPYEEIIIVDDVHAFGQGRPQKILRWDEVTVDSIREAVSRHKALVSSEVLKDEFVLYVKGRK